MLAGLIAGYEPYIAIVIVLITFVVFLFERFSITTPSGAGIEDARVRASSVSAILSKRNASARDAADLYRTDA